MRRSRRVATALLLTPPAAAAAAAPTPAEAFGPDGASSSSAAGASDSSAMLTDAWEVERGELHSEPRGDPRGCWGGGIAVGSSSGEPVAESSVVWAARSRLRPLVKRPEAFDSVEPRRRHLGRTAPSPGSTMIGGGGSSSSSDRRAESVGDGLLYRATTLPARDGHLWRVGARASAGSGPPSAASSAAPTASLATVDRSLCVTELLRTEPSMGSSGKLVSENIAPSSAAAADDEDAGGSAAAGKEVAE